MGVVRGVKVRVKAEMMQRTMRNPLANREAWFHGQRREPEPQQRLFETNRNLWLL